ncbi:MAG: hypothetical protein ABS77_03220 [Phenylobacterium sp. SCN 69-14]|nr:MAG: hypothetical protein ABS77_03220 [Phenylobacterium sp. SCN 69-14]
MARIDHLVWVAPNLERAIEDLAERTGALALPGGAHLGNGTRNAILGLGTRTYLEVLAPDPAQAPLAAPAGLSALKAPRLHTFAVAAERLDRIAAQLEKAGLPHPGVIPMSRRLPSGRLVRWRLLTPAGHPYGQVVPFFIDWGDSPHPADQTSEAGEACRLEGLTVTHPEAWSLRALLERLEVEVEVETGPPALNARLSTPRGEVAIGSA